MRGRFLPVLLPAAALMLATACAAPAPDPVASASETTQAQAPAVDPIGPVTATYNVVATGTEARYRVRETLANRTLPNDAVGVTKEVAGSVAFTAEGVVVPSRSKITVGLKTLQSDRNQRDDTVRKQILQIPEFPTVTFVPKKVTGVQFPPPASGETDVQITGDMTVKTVTREVTWAGKLTYGANQVSGKLTTLFQFPYFNIEKPSVAAVLSVTDDIKLELDFTAAKAP